VSSAGKIVQQRRGDSTRFTPLLLGCSQLAGKELAQTRVVLSLTSEFFNLSQ